jgi:hypothetical protein
VLAKQLDMLLSHGTSLVDSLAALSSALCELLGLVLNLSVQAVKNREDGAFKFLCGRVVLVGNSLQSLSENASLQLELKHAYLSVRPDVLKHARNASKRLIEVVALL